MMLNGEWFCDECGEELNDHYYSDELHGQCVCENCMKLNDIVEENELQNDGLDKEDGSTERQEAGMKEKKTAESRSIEELVREIHQLMENVDHVLGASRRREKEEQIRDCINSFKDKMLDRCVEQGSENIIISIMEVYRIVGEIEMILNNGIITFDGLVK